MATVTLQIQGMSCQHCVSAVSKALKGLPGVEEAQVAIGSAVVRYDPAKVTVDKLKAAVEDQGYNVTGVAE